MGKKGVMNRHAAEAMERKNIAESSKAAKKAQAEDDAAWADDGDKKGKKKAAKQDDKAAKDREKAARKAERDAIEREEEASMKSKVTKKLTKAQIDASTASKPKPKKQYDVVSEEQQARQLMKGNDNANTSVDATGLKEASEQLARVNLASTTAADDHPERRLKAAHLAFEEKTIPMLKADNPGLKRSQLKELCFKQWQKSPENPMVQQAMKMHQVCLNFSTKKK